MKKHILNPEEIKAVDKFIEDFYEKSGHFGYADLKEKYPNESWKYIYELINHRAFVVVMYITAPHGATTEEKEQIEKFRFTDKGHLVYQLGGYEDWLTLYNDEIRYKKHFPFYSLIGLWSTPLLALALVIIELINSCNERSCNISIDHKLLKEQTLVNMPKLPHSLKDTCLIYSKCSHVVDSTPQPPSRPN